MSIDRRGVLLSGGAFVAVSVGFGVATAHEYDVGKLKIEHPWLRAPKDGETNARLFMFIHNNGDKPDKLIGVKSANIGKAELHVAPQFSALADSIFLPAGATVTLAPGGSYVELLDIKKINPVGWGFELALVFEKAGEVTIDAAIDAPDALHAHDAEAMERWEKSHGQAGEAPSGQEMHHDRHQMDHDPMDHDSMDHDSMDHEPSGHGEMDHGAGAPAPQPE